LPRTSSPPWQIEERFAVIRAIVRGAVGALLDPNLPKKADPIPE